MKGDTPSLQTEHRNSIDHNECSFLSKVCYLKYYSEAFALLQSERVYEAGHSCLEKDTVVWKKS